MASTVAATAPSVPTTATATPTSTATATPVTTPPQTALAVKANPTVTTPVATPPTPSVPVATSTPPTPLTTATTAATAPPQPKLRTPLAVGAIPTLPSELPAIAKGAYQVDVVFDLMGSISQFAATSEGGVARVIENPHVTFGGDNIVILRTEIVEMTSNCSNSIAVDIPGGVDTLVSCNNMGYKAAVLPGGRVSNYVVYSSMMTDEERALVPLAFDRRFPADPKTPGSSLVPARFAESLVSEQNRKLVEAKTSAVVKYAKVDEEVASIDNPSWSTFVTMLKPRLAKAEDHMINPTKPLKYEFKPVGCTWRELEEKHVKSNPETGRFVCQMPFVIGCHLRYTYLLEK